MADAPRGWLRLLQWAGLAIAGAAGWILAVGLAFRLPLTVDTLAGAAPEEAKTVYVAGLYLWLMASAWWIWRRDGTPVRVAFSGGRLLEGWAAGLAGLAILAAIELAVGLAHRSSTASFDPGGFGLALLAAMAFAISEEALFRGFMLGLLARSFRRMTAVWASAAIFAALHFLRPVSPGDIALPFAGLFAAGAFLAACRLRTGSLWLGIGVHAAWVWFVTANGQQGWLVFPDAGRLWTGGGSLAAGLLGLLGVAGLYQWLVFRYR